MWRESSSVKAVNLVKKSFTLTEIIDFSKGIVFLLAHPVGYVGDAVPSQSPELSCIVLRLFAYLNPKLKIQVALLWQRDRATRLSVEILQLQNIPIVRHYLRDPTFSRFYTIPECDRHTHRNGRTDT